jgi:hypothetical protein
MATRRSTSPFSFQRRRRSRAASAARRRSASRPRLVGGRGGVEVGVELGDVVADLRDPEPAAQAVAGEEVVLAAMPEEDANLRRSRAFSDRGGGSEENQEEQERPGGVSHESHCITGKTTGAKRGPARRGTDRGSGTRGLSGTRGARPGAA